MERKRRNASYHRGENERQRKKVNRNTYNIFPIKRVTRKFLEVSLCSRAKQRHKNIQKGKKKKVVFGWLEGKCAARAKVFFLVIRIIRSAYQFRGEFKWHGFILVEIFREKSNTFRGITFFPFLAKQPKFSVPFVWITSARLQVERKRTCN